jgi:hypothetical protein
MYEGHSRRTKPLFFEYTENFSGNGKGGRGDRLGVYKVGNDQVVENNESSRCARISKNVNLCRLLGCHCTENE